MLHSILIGVVAGARSLTPLAMLSLGARGRATRGHAPRNRASVPALLERTLARPAVTAGTSALAAGELWGDKLRSAPDRIVLAGMAAHLTFQARQHAMQRYGQTRSGLVEDGLALGLAWLVTRPARH